MLAINLLLSNYFLRSHRQTDRKIDINKEKKKERKKEERKRERNDSLQNYSFLFDKMILCNQQKNGTECT